MTGDTVGGVWTFTLELAAALVAEGVEVVLATFGGFPSPQQQTEAAAIPNLFLRPTEYRLEWMPEPWKDVEESGRWLLALADDYSPDAIHLNTFGHGGLPFRKPVVLTAHSCVLSWWDAVKGGRAPSEWDRYAAVVKSALFGAGTVTAPSRTMAAALRKHYGLVESEVIYNGRDARRFTRSAAKEAVVFSAGRLWDQAKNAAMLAKVAPLLSWPVYMAGDGTSLGKLSADTMADWYSRAAIYALPARYEPFGLSVLEAALSGCALVLGDIPSLREIWGDTAVFVSPDDAEALRAALESLIDDPAFRVSLAQRSYERALSYRVDRMARRYRDAYQHALCAL
jgi:glycosyltransferase involved in cell wall biosynthesis